LTGPNSSRAARRPAAISTGRLFVVKDGPEPAPSLAVVDKPR
jgi:hypothetical protein